MNMRAILHFWRACSLACSQRWSGLFLRKPASATEWKKILYISHNCTLFAIIVTSSPNVTFFFIWPIVYFYTIHCDISKFWLSCNFVFFSFLPQFELFLIFRTLFLIILCCFLWSGIMTLYLHMSDCDNSQLQFYHNFLYLQYIFLITLALYLPMWLCLVLMTIHYYIFILLSTIFLNLYFSYC